MATGYVDGTDRPTYQGGSIKVGELRSVMDFGDVSDVGVWAIDEREMLAKTPLDHDLIRPNRDRGTTVDSAAFPVRESSAATTSAMLANRSLGDFATIFMQICSSGESCAMV